MTKTDAQLLRAARAAAPPFRELYERHTERIHGYHLRRTRDADAAHDLAAETFARAWLLRRRFRDDASGSAAQLWPRRLRVERVGRLRAPLPNLGDVDSEHGPFGRLAAVLRVLLRQERERAV